jgi:polar amino acid transport system substrate-binding protein
MQFSIIIMTLLLLIFCSSLPAKDRIVLGAPAGNIADISSEILLYAYDHIGLPIKIVSLPDERSLLWSNSGHIDGEILRIASVSEMYPNLVRIPIVIDKFEAMAFTKRKDVVIQGWDGLRSYSILLRIGTKFAERGTKGMNVKAFPSNERVFDALHLGRYDIAVASRLTGMYELERLGLTDIKVVEPALAEYSLYHYLNKKHETIIRKITLQLEKMERNGMIEKIRKEYIKKPSSR